jgi:hypothetical protein
MGGFWGNVSSISPQCDTLKLPRLPAAQALQMYGAEYGQFTFDEKEYLPCRRN